MTVDTPLAGAPTEESLFDTLEDLGRLWAVPEAQDPDSATARAVEREIQAESIGTLIALAEAFPEGWTVLRQYLVHASRQYAYRNSDVSPDMDPVRSHAERCANSGAAMALARFAKGLDPADLRTKMSRLRDPDTLRRVKTHA